MYVQWGESPIWLASFNGHEECVDQLIKAGANVDVPQEVSVTRKLAVCPLSAWRVVVCGAELLWCPVCVSVETDVIVMIIGMAKPLNSLKVGPTIASSAYGQ